MRFFSGRCGGGEKTKVVRQTMEEGDVYRLWREGGCSYDESRHVSPLKRVFLGFELAAAVAGMEFRCGPVSRFRPPQVEMLLSIQAVRV